MTTDYYELLGVSPTASDAVIRAAFRTLVADATSDQPRFAALNEAFDVLKDPEKRAAYDQQRLAASPERTVAGFERTMAGAERTVAGFERTVAGTVGTGQTTPAGAIVRAADAPPPAPRPDTCSACGTATPPGSVWCPECGLRCGTIAGALPGGASLPAPTLVARDGRTWTLTMGTNTVGRERADITLTDPSVSRSHARLTVDSANRVLLADAGSTNGTRCGGAKIAPSREIDLSDGTELVFGNVALVIRIPSPPGLSRTALPAGSAPASAPVAAIAGSGAAVPRLVAADGTIHRLSAAQNIVGRKTDCTIVISGDPHVSGRHARIDWQDGKCHFTDLGSTNGSWVGSERSEPGRTFALTDGVTITVGKTRLTFRMGV